MAANESGGDSESMIRFELYIKASAIDKETKGSCPICQQFFMITCLLGESQEDIDFKVFTVQADCPPKNFAAGWSKKYPVIMVLSGKSKTGQDLSGMMYDEFEEVESFFESINRECPELKRKNAPNISAMQVIENLYKHFNYFISGQSEKGLVSELKKLNDFLESQDTKFLCDNVLSFADCHLLPRLQHIRVASKAYRDFDIPKEFTHIWKYLKNAYEQDAFKSTMPSDQDIVFHYEKKAGGPPKVKGQRSARPTLEKFTYTTDVPDSAFNGTSGSSPSKEAHDREPAQEQHLQRESRPRTYGASEFAAGGLASQNPDNGEKEEDEHSAPDGPSHDRDPEDDTDNLTAHNHTE